MRSSERPTGAVWRLLEAWAKQEQQRDRLNRRVTQGEMAALFQVTPQILSAWKRCTSRMQMDDQLRIVKATGISQEDLALALAEDEPRIARAIAARGKDAEELMGNAEHPAATNEPGDGPGSNVTRLPTRAEPRRGRPAARDVGKPPKGDPKHLDD
jgi:hypothetical protein